MNFQHKVQVFTNARIILPDQEISGWLAIDDGLIVDIGEGRAPESGHDLEGDFLMPGLVELHTDNLEGHLKPRPKVTWPKLSSVMSYDSQLIASGITTVFDSLRAGNDADYAPAAHELTDILEALETARRSKFLRADHRLHLRCEICSPDVIEQATGIVAGHTVDLISLMDHTPGARQFLRIEAWKTYYGGKSGLSDDQLEELMARKREQFAVNYLPHRGALVNLAHANNIVIASHDDSTAGHVDESVADRVSFAEFPTTVEAAQLSHDAGIAVLMGAPNVVRGGSHSGNVAAVDLGRHGVLDILSSDYVPASLLMGAFALADQVEVISLSEAMRTVTLNPARATGLNDRGAIAKGLRADLLRVHRAYDLPVVREVYRNGQQVA